MSSRASWKTRFLEDLFPVAHSESWNTLAEMSPVPICTGNNWMRRVALGAVGAPRVALGRRAGDGVEDRELG